jgi:hypothetical protein
VGLLATAALVLLSPPGGALGRAGAAARADPLHASSPTALVVGSPAFAHGAMSFVSLTAPTATTGPATEVSSTSAVLTGSFKSEGEAECDFEYGLTSDYGTKEFCVPPEGGGFSAIPASATLTGLLPNTTYHYRILARLGEHTTFGADATLTTLASSGPASTEDPTKAATARDGSLSAEASGGTGTITVGHYASGTGAPPLPNGTGGYVDVYTKAGATFTKVVLINCGVGAGAIAWWYDPGVGWTGASSQTYSPGPPACITVVITPSTSPSLEQLSGTELGYEPNPAPSATTGTATAVSTSSAVLNGSFDPNGPIFTECSFQYGTTAAYGSTVPCSPRSGAGAATVAAAAALSGLAQGTTYHYRIVASNGEHTTFGADATFATLQPPRPGPSPRPPATVSVSTTIAGVHITLSAPNRCLRHGLVQATLSLRIPSHKRKGTVVVKIYKVVFKVGGITRTQLRRHLSNAPFRLKIVIKHPIPKTRYVLTARAFIAVTHGPKRSKSLHVTLTTCP